MTALGSTSDEELVFRIAAADRRALATLYDRYAPQLLAMALRVLGSRSEAEDLLHDVYMEVWRQAHTYTSERGTVRTWLSIRLRSRALDRRRRQRKLTFGDEHAERLAEGIACEGEPTPFVDQAVVRRALASLPAEQRVVLEMFYFDGLSLPEIGKQLEIPLGTVKSRAARALARLKTELDGPEGAPRSAGT